MMVFGPELIPNMIVLVGLALRAEMLDVGLKNKRRDGWMTSCALGAIRWNNTSVREEDG